MKSTFNDRFYKELKAKRKHREIEHKKKMGIKNPYDHFINFLPDNLPKLGVTAK